MVRQERASRDQAGATVEVIGYEEDAALRLLSMDAARHLRLTFDRMDKQGHQELYAFMQQDPSHPTPVLVMPRTAGAPTAKSDAEWLR